ncbi:MAG: SRPBCC domain-containing protein [Gaiellales bacterium]
MTSNAAGDSRILGSLRLDDGTGTVHMEDRLDAGIDDVWAALTDPARLAGWISEVEGDLRVGGEFRARHLGGGWVGTGRVDRCEPPHRLALTMRDADPQPGQPEETVTEVRLAVDGPQTFVVVEERGLPVDLLAAYGAGVQMHVENLAAHIAGRPLCGESRWDELMPAYSELAAKLG